MNANNYIIGLLSVKYIERRDTFSRLNCIFPNFTNFPRNENQWIKRFPRIHQHVVRWIPTRGVKLEIVPCRRTSNRSWTMLHDFSFPFIRPSRCSRRASPRRRIGGEKKKNLLASAEIENYRAIFRATPSREDVESSVLEIVMQTK